MNSFLTQLRGAVVSTVVLAAVTCGAYPLIVTGISRAAFKDKADGSLIKDGALAALCLCCAGAHDARLWMAPLPFQQSADPEPRDFLRTWPTTGKYAP